MAIVLDILTKLDASALTSAARELESRLSGIGKAAAGASVSDLDKAMKDAALSTERLEISQMKLARTTENSKSSAIRLAQAHHEVAIAQAANERSLASLSAVQVSSMERAGAAAGVALAGMTALAVGTAAALVSVGEKFEQINRQIVVSTGASGAALNSLNESARNVMSSVDTSVKSIGTDLGVLSNRLNLAGNDPALSILAKHIEELKDRFGEIDIRALTGAFVQFGVSGKDADDTLASLMKTAQNTSEPLGQLISNVQAFGETLQQAGLNIEQSASLIGKMDEILGPGGATKAMTGFAHAEKDAADQGVTFQKFLTEAAQSIQAYMRVGDQASAQALMQDIFGVRNWPQAQAVLNAYMTTLHAGADSFKVPGSAIDDMSNKTRNLGNLWNEVHNKILSALSTPGTNAVDTVSKQMEKFVDWIDQHQDDIRNVFQNAIGAIIDVAKGVGDIVSYLGKTPQLVEAIGLAFIGWKVAGIVTGVATAISGMNVALAGSATAGAVAAGGLSAVSVVAVPLIGVLGALAVSIANIVKGAQHGWDWYMSHSPIGLLSGHHPGDDDKGQQQSSESKPPGKSFYKDWYPNQGPAQGPLAPGEVRPPAMPGTSGVPGVPGAMAPGDIPDDGSPILTPDALGGQKGPRLPVAPEVPYSKEFKAPLMPGESESHYADRGNVMESQHKVAEDQARLQQLEKTNTATAEDLQKARNKLDEDIRSEQESRARLQENEAKALKKHADTLEDFGAKIDNDFGISKGLPGIAENLFKFLAGLVSAPIIGAAQGFNATQGGPTFGAKGLLGAAALGGAFGDQFTPQGLQQASGGGVGGGSSGGSGGGNWGDLGMPGESGTPPGDASFGDSTGGSGTPPGDASFGDTTGGGVPGSAGEKLGSSGESVGPQGQQGASLEAWINQAEKAAGVDASWTPGLKVLIGRESGGNPNAINLTDSNAAAGHPSQGLMQTIPGTFHGNHVPGTSDSITDPVANIAAGIRYIQSRYGGIKGVQQADPTRPPKGYEHGGLVQFSYPGLPGYAAGGELKGQGEIPIMAHEGEHVLTKADVAAMGGHDGVYKMRQDLHQSPTMQYLSDASSDKAGPQSPIPKAEGPKILPPGVMTVMPKTVQGGAQPGPSMIGTMAPPTGHGEGFAITGGGLIGLAESLPSTAASMAMMGAGAAAGGGAVDDVRGGMPGGGSPAMPAPPPPPTPPAPAGAAGATPGGSSGGGAKASGGSPSGSVSSALIGIGIQEMNAAIAAGGQAAGAIVGGLDQTFGPGQFAQSKLAQGGWFNKVIGGITGAQPQLPNMAGQTHQAGSLTPEQAASAGGGTPAIGSGSAQGQQAGNVQNGHTVNIENYNVSHTEDRAGQDLARQVHAGATNSLTGSR
jgi:Transglycosylase SLT domain